MTSWTTSNTRVTSIFSRIGIVRISAFEGHIARYFEIPLPLCPYIVFRPLSRPRGLGNATVHQFPTWYSKKYTDDATSVELLAQLGNSPHAVVLLELRIQMQEDKQLLSISCCYKKTRKPELVEAATAPSLDIGKCHRHVACA